METWGPIVSWVLFIAGWIFLYCNSNRLASRSEIRALVRDAIDLIVTLEEKGHGYHSRPGNEKGLDAKGLAIKRHLKHLSNILLTLKRINNDFYFKNELINLRQTITSGYFDSKDRPALGFNTPHMLAISNSALNLINALESKFKEIYK